MKITAQFNDRPPVELDGLWRIEIEIAGSLYEIIPQMVDRGEPAGMLRIHDIGKCLQIIPHGSNSIRFGAK